MSKIELPYFRGVLYLTGKRWKKFDLADLYGFNFRVWFYKILENANKLVFDKASKA